ncbi:inositol polyphosphate kinase family protein [Piscirickettsia salmonis]|uniref:inositol polyphosphate kinase family protein n=1 Tax=Piscirickettsia salmonis TaxID=1238 RepID=UPI0007C8C067|nr:Inositol polyphosphate kinase [Piscirickettsiaceae bacterium NZ-RLO1]
MPKHLAAAGHVNAIDMHEDYILKKASDSEILAYQLFCFKGHPLNHVVANFEIVNYNLLKLTRIDARMQNASLMDIKIGYQSTSYQEAQKDKQPLQALVKAGRMKCLDSFYGSTVRGYRLEGYTKNGSPVAAKSNLAGCSKYYIAKELTSLTGDGLKIVVNIVTKAINEIISALAEQQIAFFSSSLLIAVDHDTPEKSQAKLIDLAHYVTHADNQTEYERAEKSMTKGLLEISSTFSAILNNKEPLLMFQQQQKNRQEDASTSMDLTHSYH